MAHPAMVTARRIKRLEAENARLRRSLAESAEN
jgi:hypothetical protein